MDLHDTISPLSRVHRAAVRSDLSIPTQSFSNPFATTVEICVVCSASEPGWEVRRRSEVCMPVTGQVNMHKCCSVEEPLVIRHPVLQVERTQYTVSFECLSWNTSTQPPSAAVGCRLRGGQYSPHHFRWPMQEFVPLNETLRGKAHHYHI